MTMGSDNLSNGPETAQDRFSSGVNAYRQSRREALTEHGDGELMSRRESGRESNGLPSRSSGMSSALSPSLEPTSSLDRAAKLPSLDMHGLTEPVFGAVGWSDSGSSALSMADHPLLRGLLLELPARGAMPASDWLDRWFEAARSILELLYVQEAKKR
jgi:hypothetical protein